MLTRVGAAARRSDLSIGQFQQHWREQHGPTAGAIPNLRRYVQHHALLVDGRPVLPYPGFDACSELDFDSLETMDEGFARATQLGELRADEDRFVDKSRFTWMLGSVDERRPTAEVRDPVTLLTWWRAHPSSTADGLRAVLTGEWEAAIDQRVQYAGRRLIVARADWHAGRRPASADVIEVIVFDGVGAALGFVAEEAHDLGPIVAGIAFGAERHLARPVVVTTGSNGSSTS